MESFFVKFLELSVGFCSEKFVKNFVSSKWNFVKRLFLNDFWTKFYEILIDLSNFNLFFKYKILVCLCQ